jgi:hypothetical protein
MKSGTVIIVLADERPEASPEEELQELKKPCFATQWNAALYDDACLIVVPGSHRRARTPDEKRVNLEADGRGVMPRYLSHG